MLLPVFSVLVSSTIVAVSESKVRVKYSRSSPSASPLIIYPLAWIVEMVGAKVEGLPIPFSSNIFTRDASVYRAGGFEKVSRLDKSSNFTTSPLSTFGKSLSLSSAPYAFKKPSNVTISPFAVNVDSRFFVVLLSPIVTVVRSS